MKSPLRTLLVKFARTHGFHGKGALCVALVVTQRAKSGLPIDPNAMLTPGKGQVEGLGKSQVQAILARHDIERVLAEEGGRTSRGSVGNMQNYVAFLNGLGTTADLDEIERFWIDRVREFFAGKPFKLRVDASLSIRAAIRDLLSQAKTRQSQIPGSRYEGAMLQHLIGAKLEIVLGDGKIEHHSSSEADQAEGRAGDFMYGDVAIHVTANPGEAVVRKCRANLDNGLRPLIITTSSRISVAAGLAEDAGIEDRLDALDVEQFLAANLHERSLFSSANRRPNTEELVRRYNAIIDAVETDPSLKIELAGPPSTGK